jgi:beta-lactamase regulating signal transducer with metallopeptidase domain
MAWWLFQNVVITAALALAVAAACRSGRIGPVGRHALWLVVLVKFVTPPLVVWPWGVPDPLRVAAIGINADNERAAGLAPPQADDAAAPIFNAGISLSAGSLSPGRALTPLAAGSLAAFWPWLLGVWAAGSLGLLGVEGVRIARLARRTRAAWPAGPALASRVAALSERLGMRPVAVRVVPGDAPPAVWCFGRPQVLWPADFAADASEVCVDGLLLHELAHVKRGDHLVGWVELAAGVVWWWNPLFWFVRSALREQAELACDAWVISALPNGRRAYAESLLALSGAAVRGPMSMAVVGIRASSRRVLERRLAMIMKGRAPLHLTRVGLLSLALMAAVIMPGWAAASQDPPPPPPRPAVAAVPVVAPTQTPPLTAPTPATRVQTPRAVVSPSPAASIQTPRAVSTPSPAARAQATRQTPPPRPPVRARVLTPPKSLVVYIDRTGDNLPAEGQQLLKGFDADREAIQLEAEQKIEARLQALVKALEEMQEQYTKAGRLDEAVAIRDFLRSGLPALKVRYALKRGVR